MARPPKDDEDRRSETLRARVTMSEHEAIKRNAALVGLGASEYVRRRALEYRMPQSGDAELVVRLNELSLQLSKVGNLANQLARAAHTGRRAHVAWETVADQLEELAAKTTLALEEVVSDGS